MDKCLGDLYFCFFLILGSVFIHGRAEAHALALELLVHHHDALETCASSDVEEFLTMNIGHTEESNLILRQQQGE